MLDFVKRRFLGIIEPEINRLNFAIQQKLTNATPDIENSEISAESSSEHSLLEKFQSIYVDITNDLTIFEFTNMVTGSVIEFSKVSVNEMISIVEFNLNSILLSNQNTEKKGIHDLFQGGVSYSFGKLDDQNNFISFLF